MSQWRAHRGYGGGGREEEGPVRPSIPGQRVVGRGAKLLGQHWLQCELGERGRRPGHVLSRQVVGSCSHLGAIRGLDPRVSLLGLESTLRFRGPPVERPPNLQVAAPRRRRRRRRTPPGRPRSRSCCTVPASVSGSTCAWGSASCP